MKIIAEQLIKDLKLKVTNEEVANLKRPINGVTYKRAGLELSGLKISEYYSATIIAWGTKEILFFDSLSQAKIDKALDNVLSSICPLILLSDKVLESKHFSVILKKANLLKIPIVALKTAISYFQPKLTTYLIPRNIEVQAVHGSLVIIHGQGVLIKGASGIGKSEAVLELVHNGHTFVSDDTVEIFSIGNECYGKPANITKDMLEARGIGIVNIPYIYGVQAVAEQAKIDLIIELIPENRKNMADRLGNQNMSETLGKIEVDKMQIPTGQGRSVAALIEAATNVYIAKKMGYDQIALINSRMGDKNE